MSDKIALIDIGSNSVRLVVYDCSCFIPVVIFNERALCALGVDLESTGNLSVEGLDLAKRSLKRFIAIASKCAEVKIFATSAVREARDGKSFTKYIEDTYGVEIDTLTAEEEARFSALGIMSSIMEVEGIMGDLGGGSLELAQISENEIISSYSFPVGSLRIKGYQDDQNLSYLLHKFFSESDLVKKLKGSNFYAVGGGFRALAKVYIEHISYPIKTLHNYKVSADDMLNSLDLMISSSIKISGISAKRVSVIPLASAVLSTLIKIGKPNEIVFSSCGVREGILFDSLSVSSKKSDVLLARCIDIVGREYLGYSEALHSWLDVFLKDSSQRKKRIALAACYLVNFASKRHDKYRAQYAFENIIELPLLSIDHNSRIFLALLLFHRYQTNVSPKISNVVSLLSIDDMRLAKILGMAMRFACVLSAGLEDVLKGSKLDVQEGSLILKIIPEIEDFVGEATQKRMSNLADLLNLDDKISITRDL